MTEPSTEPVQRNPSTDRVLLVRLAQAMVWPLPLMDDFPLAEPAPTTNPAQAQPTPLQPQTKQDHA